MSCSQSSVGAVEAAIDYAVGLVGIKALKPLQRDAIRTFVGGEMCLCLFPQGSASLYAMLFCRLCSTVCDAAKEHQLLSTFPHIKLTATTLL